MRALTAFRIAAVLMITLLHGHVSAVEFVLDHVRWAWVVRVWL